MQTAFFWIATRQERFHADAEHEATYGESLNGSEAQDNGGDTEASASKDGDEDSPNGLSGAPEDNVRRKAPVIRKIMGPKLPQLQPAIHSGSTSAGVCGPSLQPNIYCMKQEAVFYHAPQRHLAVGQ